MGETKPPSCTSRGKLVLPELRASKEAFLHVAWLLGLRLGDRLGRGGEVEGEGDDLEDGRRDGAAEARLPVAAAEILEAMQSLAAWGWVGGGEQMTGACTARR